MGYRVEVLKNKIKTRKLRRRKIITILAMIILLINSIYIVNKSNTYLMGIDSNFFAYSYDYDSHYIELFGEKYVLNNNIDELYLLLKEKINNIKNKYL